MIGRRLRRNERPIGPPMSQPVGSSAPVLPGPIPAPPSLIPALPWRLLVATSGFAGYVLATREVETSWEDAGHLAGLAAGSTYLLLAVLAGLRSQIELAMLRGALATVMVLVAASCLIFSSGDLSSTESLTYLITPALVVTDYLVFVRGPNRWWHPAAFLVFPLAYLAYLAHDGWDDLRLVAARDAEYGGVAVVAGLLVAAFAVGCILCGIASARADLVARRH